MGIMYSLKGPKNCCLLLQLCSVSGEFNLMQVSTREKKQRQKQTRSIRRSSKTSSTKRSQTRNRKRRLGEMRSWGNSVELWGHTSVGRSRGQWTSNTFMDGLRCLLFLCFAFWESSLPSASRITLASSCGCVSAVSASLACSQTSVVSAAAFEELG